MSLRYSIAGFVLCGKYCVVLCRRKKEVRLVAYREVKRMLKTGQSEVTIISGPDKSGLQRGLFSGTIVTFVLGDDCHSQITAKLRSISCHDDNLQSWTVIGKIVEGDYSGSNFEADLRITLEDGVCGRFRHL